MFWSAKVCTFTAQEWDMGNFWEEPFRWLCLPEALLIFLTRKNQGENWTIVTIPDLHQTEITCETGPGSPSGHLMENYAMFYVLADFLTTQGRVFATPPIAKRLVWTAFVTLLILLFLSRTYCSAHFPDQCILGMIFGKIGHALVKLYQGLRNFNLIQV